MNDKAKELGNKLWDIACKLLRGNMKAGDFQDYMLSFIFLRYISEQYEKLAEKELGNEYVKSRDKLEEIIKNKSQDKIIERYENIIEQFINKKIDEYIKNHPTVNKEDIKNNKEYEIYRELLYSKQLTPLTLWFIENIEDIQYFENQMRKKHRYIIKPQYLWNNLYLMALDQNDKLLSLLYNGFKYIEDESFEDTFQGLFSEVHLDSEKLGKNYKARNEMICNIISEIGKGLSEFTKDIDILGDAYEILISKFASNSGTKAGEFYTPQSVSNILSEIVTFDSQEPKNGKKSQINNLLDFACGSGSLLINVIKHMEDKKINHIYGQEKNITTYNLARMNILLHKVKDNKFEIFHGDTLKNEWDIFNDINPANKIKCDAVVANPPFSNKWEHQTKYLEDFRFKDYGLAPQSAADYAFLLHGFHYLDNQGTMAIILSHGILFRGGAEAKIRRKLIEDNNIDAIIGLPANLFYSTGIPVCIVVLKKCKKYNDILFINANKEYVKGRGQNELSNENVQKIVDTYRQRKNIDNFSRTVELGEIIENDYNLNISRYVSTAEEDKIIDNNIVHKALVDIENAIKKAKEEHNQYLKELNLPELP